MRHACLLLLAVVTGCPDGAPPADAAIATPSSMSVPEGPPFLAVAVNHVQATSRLRLGMLVAPTAGLIVQWERGSFDSDHVFELGPGAQPSVTLRTGPSIGAQHIFLAGPAIQWPPRLVAPQGTDERGPHAFAPDPAYGEETARSGRVLVTPIDANHVRVTFRDLVFATARIRELGPVDVALDQPPPP